MGSHSPKASWSDGPAQFRTTHWSVVLRAGRSDVPEAVNALDSLCRAYWHPIYGFVRRQGYKPEDAKDLVQGFFADLLQRAGLEEVHPTKGRFRSFLLASVTHYLANQRERKNTQKRGGGVETISLEAQSEEERHWIEPVHESTPERLYEQRWAHAVLEGALSRLEAEFADTGHAKRFEALKGFLSGDIPGQSYAEAAAALGLSVGAVTSIIHRMRLRHRELFRDEIAQTVDDPGEIDDEIRHLISVLTP
jgi:RNA polymerase sigma factor (sigma-70 family)